MLKYVKDFFSKLIPSCSTCDIYGKSGSEEIMECLEQIEFIPVRLQHKIDTKKYFIDTPEFFEEKVTRLISSISKSKRIIIFMDEANRKNISNASSEGYIDFKKESGYFDEHIYPIFKKRSKIEIELTFKSGWIEKNDFTYNAIKLLCDKGRIDYVVTSSHISWFSGKISNDKLIVLYNDDNVVNKKAYDKIVSEFGRDDCKILLDSSHSDVPFVDLPINGDIDKFYSCGTCAISRNRKSVIGIYRPAHDLLYKLLLYFGLLEELKIEK